MSLLRLSKYPQYTDSQIEWLGLMPKSWAQCRISDVALPNKVKNTALTEKNLLSLSYGQIIRKDINTTFGLLPDSFDGYQIVNSGTMVLRLTDLQNDQKSLRVGWVKQRGIITSAYLCLNLHKSKLLAGFSYYLLYTYDISKVFYWFGGGLRSTMRFDDIKALPFFIPPKRDQQEIATYLDSATTQIDQKIDLLTRKSEHYEKLKKTLINQTVTSGLDKTAVMKDTGVEWIGEIPAHWKITAITNVTSTVSTKNHPNEELLSVYRDYGVIIKSSRDDNHNQAGSDLSGYKLVNPGYLVINKMKAWQGSLGISEYRGIVSPAYITCKTNGKLLQRSYLHHLLRCQAYIDEYNRLSFGVRIGQWDMRYVDFKYVPVLLPPLKEQKAIADYLDEKTSKIDQIVITISTQIEKLKELRKTLINDVVTGKMKVTDEGTTA
jgi:type I restriction enzyme, S subunit